MKTVKINDTLYKFPESWNEVNIKIFQKINKINELEEFEKLLNLVSLLGNVPIEELESISFTELNKLYQLITFTNDKQSDYIAFKTSIGGKEYGLDYEWKTMKAKTYIDLDSYLSDKDNVIDNLHYIAAILFRPINKVSKKGYELEEYDYNKLDENALFMLENMNINQILPALFFFSNLNQNLLITTLDSLVPKRKKIRLKKIQMLILKLKHLVKGGVGLPRFMIWLKTIFEKEKNG